MKKPFGDLVIDIRPGHIRRRTRHCMINGIGDILRPLLVGVGRFVPGRSFVHGHACNVTI
jgi:hypothetical protein